MTDANFQARSIYPHKKILLHPKHFSNQHYTENAKHQEGDTLMKNLSVAYAKVKHFLKYQYFRWLVILMPLVLAACTIPKQM